MCERYNPEKGPEMKAYGVQVENENRLKNTNFGRMNCGRCEELKKTIGKLDHHLGLRR